MRLAMLRKKLFNYTGALQQPMSILWGIISSEWQRLIVGLSVAMKPLKRLSPLLMPRNTGSHNV